MTEYELPDGFQGMESLPKENVKVNILYIDGDICPNMTDYLREVGENPGRIGWAPIVPPKKKRRFVVEGYEWRGTTLYRVTDTTRRIDDNWCAGRILTRQHAEELASLYEKMHEPAYEGGCVYSVVSLGTPWQPITYPEPYVKEPVWKWEYSDMNGYADISQNGKFRWSIRLGNGVTEAHIDAMTDALNKLEETP